MKCLNLKSPLLLLLVSVFGFLLLDNLIFRSGLYDYYLADYAGRTALLKIKYVAEHETKDKPNILIPSASLWRADFRLSDFEKKNPNAPFTVLPLVVSGSGPYTQYYLLKAIDPTHQKYRTIILPLESYKTLAGFDSRDDKAYEEGRRIVTFIKPHEWPELLETYEGTNLYNKMLLASLFISRAYLDDLETFIPSRRIKQNLRTDEENYNLFYEGSSATSSIKGLQLNQKNEITSCLSFEEICERLPEVGDPPFPDSKKREESKKVLDYQKTWLTKIVDLYKNSPTQIVFMQMPHAFFDAHRLPLPDAPDLRDILPKYQNVHFVDEHYFDDINQFEYFKDDEHLNKKGSEIFTHMITPLFYKFAANTSLPRMISK